MSWFSHPAHRAVLTILLTTACAKESSRFTPGVRDQAMAEAALAALSDDTPHELFSRLDFWAREAQEATPLWGRAFARCSQRSDRPRPNCTPVLLHATALQSALLHGFMKELQAQAPGMPAPPQPPPLPGALGSAERAAAEAAAMGAPSGDPP